METPELKKILKENAVTRETFTGVYALDKLPTASDSEFHQRDRWFLICNCCPSSRIGKHWIAMFYERGGDVEFFDSFGLPPSAYDARVMAFLNSTAAEDVMYNSVPLQAIDSDACGHYCIVYGVSRSRGNAFDKIVNELSTLTRDNMVKFIVNTLL